MLTPREQDVVNLITEGLPNKQIATKLKISVRTVETHRKRAFHKLSVHSGVELVRRYLKDKLAGLEEVIKENSSGRDIPNLYIKGDRVLIDIDELADAIRKHLGGQDG